jgi:hypothetical protein
LSFWLGMDFLKEIPGALALMRHALDNLRIHAA